MNYIKRLESQRDQLGTLQAELRSLIAELATSPKYSGICPIDGSRKDWISTGDAITRLTDMERSSYE